MQVLVFVSGSLLELEMVNKDVCKCRVEKQHRRDQLFCLSLGPFSIHHLRCLIFLLHLNPCPVFLLRVPAVGPDGKTSWAGVGGEMPRSHLWFDSSRDRCGLGLPPAPNASGTEWLQQEIKEVDTVLEKIKMMEFSLCSSLRIGWRVERETCVCACYNCAIPCPVL